MFKPLLTGAVLVVAAFGLPTAGAQTKPAATASVQVPDQFSTIHDVLDRAANDLLADAVRRMADAANDSQGGVPPRSPESLVRNFDQKYRSNLSLSVAAALKRLDQLRPLLNPILEREGVPQEVAAVVVVESGGRSNALSSKGALGLWQLMPDTARRYGLVVTPSGDERLDVDLSTRAAARYLRDLYQQFGSWPLALAAYNAGEQRIQRAVERSGITDFIQLSSLRLLPQETRTTCQQFSRPCNWLASRIYQLGHGRARSRTIRTESSSRFRVHNREFLRRCIAGRDTARPSQGQAAGNPPRVVPITPWWDLEDRGSARRLDPSHNRTSG